MVQIRLTRDIFKSFNMQNTCKSFGSYEECESRDSSVGRAEDCSVNQTEVLRSIVQSWLMGEIFMVYTMCNI